MLGFKICNLKNRFNEYKRKLETYHTMAKLIRNNALFIKIFRENLIKQCFLHTTIELNKCQAGRYRISLRKDFPLTYEMANPPHQIAHRKAWNSWNTSNVDGGVRPAETAVEDIFIRKFITGTWHNLFVSEIIIKRQHNIIRIAGIVQQQASARQMYFLMGYCEELLSFWLQCPVKMELQTVRDKRDVVFKYI